MTEYEAVIGLEVHAELKTKTKIYCGCRNSFGDEPNTNVCPVCMGFPGALPVLNARAVDLAVKTGCAMNCKINEISRQDRKNYFYPDLPKGYQISQSDIPLCSDGFIDIMTDGKISRIRIKRIHIEEDAGKLLHDEKSDSTLIDFNRCGVPLVEIVTEPDLQSSAQAHAFLETVRKILLYTGVSDCRMQEGSIRCDVNVSLRKKGSNKLGTRCEMKNVNSFSAAVRSIEYEISRQLEIIRSGGKILRETRRWDDIRNMSFPMRSKESAADYRFFPEPDLTGIYVEKDNINRLKSEIPELPNSRLFRYVGEHGLSQADAEIITADIEKADLYDSCAALGVCSYRSIANRIIGDVSTFIRDTGRKISETKITAGMLTDLIASVEKGEISDTASHIIFRKLAENGGEVRKTAESLGLIQESDIERLKLLAEKIIGNNPKSAADYQNGKTNALGFLVGQCMKDSHGRVNPALIREILEKKLTQ